MSPVPIDGPSVRGPQPDRPGTRPLADIYHDLRGSRYGTLILVLCVLVGTVEGYDVQAMSLAVPLLAQRWSLDPQSIGILLSASLIGQVAGGFVLAPLGDRIGRRNAVLLGLLITGTATLAGAFAPTYGLMLTTRAVAGLGLGMALANTVAIAMEMVPISWRTMSVVLVSSGYPVGAAAGAAAVGALLPRQGVSAVFHVGGWSTLAAWLLCLVALPESPVVLAMRAGGQARLRVLLRRLGVTVGPGVALTAQTRAAGSAAAALFTPERRATTLLLWLLMFANLSLVYFFVMWLPSLIVRSGLAPVQAIRATALFSFSGIAGGLCLARLLPRLGAIAVLGGCYVATCVAVVAFANLAPGGGAFAIALFCCGFLVIGSQFCLNAVVNLFYPGPIRATGSGFALGAGRFGGVFAPIVGGAVLAHVASPHIAFYVALVPAAVSLGALLSLRRLRLVGLLAE